MRDIVCVRSRHRGTTVTAVTGTYQDRRRQPEAWAELQRDERFLSINTHTIINADYVHQMPKTEFYLSYYPHGQMSEEIISIPIGKNRASIVRKEYFEYISKEI